MQAILTNTSYGTQDIDDTLSHGPATHIASGSIPCRRCGGLLVDEPCMDSRGYGLWAMRCVQCGDRIDHTILLNRSASRRTLHQFVRAA